MVVLDGPNLLREALAAEWPLTDVFVDPERLDDRCRALVDRAEAGGADVHPVTGDVLRRVTDPVHPGPVAAIARRRVGVRADLVGVTAVLVLVGLADPGNAGTLVRAALAAGFDAVAFTAGTVEIFGPKAMRASAGTAMRLPIVDLGEVADACEALHAAGLRTVATDPQAREPHDSVDLTRPTAILLGNEAYGLSRAMIDSADVSVRIPMAGPAESLNVAMAGTVLCFETLRQRRATGAADEARPVTTDVPVPR